MYIYENMIYSEMIYLIGQLNKVKEEAIEFSKCGRSPKTHVTLTGDLTTFILNGAFLICNHVNFHDTTNDTNVFS